MLVGAKEYLTNTTNQPDPQIRNNYPISGLKIKSTIILFGVTSCLHGETLADESWTPGHVLAMHAGPSGQDMQAAY